MNRYNPDFHNRRSIRLKGYDYSIEGLYFITICCQNRICRFGTIENGKMILNEYGIIAYNEWVNTPKIRPNVELGEFIIMPNHIHGIIAITDRPPIRRGELHSPLLDSSQLDLIQTHSPLLDSSQLHSTLLDSDDIKKGVCNRGVCNRGVCKTPLPDVGITGEYQKGECNSPIPDVGNTGEYQKGECNSPIPGVCKTPQPSVGKTGVCSRGECNSPLRSPSQTVGAIVRGYKSSVTKQLGVLGFNEKLWQRNYYEHIIRNDQSFQNITEYIITNPMKWDNDTFNPLN